MYVQRKTSLHFLLSVIMHKVNMSTNTMAITRWHSLLVMYRTVASNKNCKLFESNAHLVILDLNDLLALCDC